MQKYCPKCGIPLYYLNLADCPNCGVKLRPEIHLSLIRNPYQAVILSFFFVGWGQWYNGKTWAGLKFFGVFLASCLFLGFFTRIESVDPLTARVWVLFLGVIPVVIWVYGIYDAYSTAVRINRKKEIFSEKSSFFWLPVVVFILGTAAIISLFVFGIGENILLEKAANATAIREGDTVIITYQGELHNSSVSKLRYGIGKTDHEWNSPMAGEKVSLKGDMPGTYHLLVSAVLEDGSEQKILDTYI
jgi:hypothetical protein